MPPQQQQQSDENGALWLSVLAVVIIVIVWFTMHEWITYGFFKLKLFEIHLLSPFTHNLNSLAAELQVLTPADAKSTQLQQIMLVAEDVGATLRYPVMAILLLLAIFVYFGNKSAKYRSTYTMKKLADDEVVDWPQISPVVPLDLVDTPLDQMPWAMAPNPMMFAKKHQLLDINKQAAAEDQLSSMAKLNVKLKRYEAKQAFMMQLGDYWHSTERLPIHARALFAMFAAKAHGDKDTVEKFNAQIAKSAGASQFKNIDYSGLEQILQRHTKEKDVVRVTQKHAFVYTVMASMLELARLDGVFASSDFLWLKAIDRRLWYTLNCVGRKTPFSDVAGIFSHRTAELYYNKPLFVPMVDEAVDALESAIKDILFKPSEDEA